MTIEELKAIKLGTRIVFTSRSAREYRGEIVGIGGYPGDFYVSIRWDEDWIGTYPLHGYIPSRIEKEQSNDLPQ